MEQNRGNSKALSKPGPRIVRAWFDTVVNPLLTALYVEEQYLERKDWSWNHWRGKLESVLRIVEHLGVSIEPNLLQFYGFNPDVQKIAEEHDNYVRELWMQCRALQTLLQSNEELRRVYLRATDPEMLEQLRRHGQKIDDDMSEEADLAVYAEYVINSRDMLPPHYTTAGIWNTWRDEFLKLQQASAIKSSYGTALAIAGELRKRVQTLSGLLAERRNQLSIEYDVPIVTLNEAA